MINLDPNSMKSAWSIIMLSKPRLDQWQKGSYFRFIVGWLSSWRQGSWLFQWSEAIGACLISIVFLLAPYVGTSLIGVLLIAVNCLLDFAYGISISKNSHYSCTYFSFSLLVYCYDRHGIFSS